MAGRRRRRASLLRAPAQSRSLRDRRQQDLFLPAIASRHLSRCRGGGGDRHDHRVPGPARRLSRVLASGTEGQGGGVTGVATPADNAHWPTVALGLAYRPHLTSRPDAQRRLLAGGRFLALLRVFLGSDGEIQVLAAPEIESGDAEQMAARIEQATAGG